MLALRPSRLARRDRETWMPLRFEILKRINYAVFLKVEQDLSTVINNHLGNARSNISQRVLRQAI